MAVFRVEKTKDYTIMANHHLRNRLLSLKAKGLLSLMLSLPDDWDYTLQGLSMICKEGLDAIREGVRELEQQGYVVRKRRRNEKGRMMNMEYVIYESPHIAAEEAKHQASPDKDQPALDQPTSEKPALENPTLDQPMRGKPTQENHREIKTNRSNKHPEKTKGLKTYPSRTDPSIHLSQEAGLRNAEITKQLRTIVRQHICYEGLIHQYDRDRLDEIVEIIVEVLCSSKEYIAIGADEYPAELVKERFSRLNSLHIEYAFDSLNNNSSGIRNIKGYLLAILFNAPVTLTHYYDAKARHDLSL